MLIIVVRDDEDDEASLDKYQVVLMKELKKEKPKKT